MAGTHERMTEVYAAVYRAGGMEPPWERVWRDGVDVTDEPPETWPWNPNARIGA
jgi:hypothetical protein